MSADVVPRRDCLSVHKDKFISRPLVSQMGHSERNWAVRVMYTPR
jgi:hypothetical protein